MNRVHGAAATVIVQRTEVGYNGRPKTRHGR